jgi:SSS family solute:Na+ symporter
VFWGVLQIAVAIAAQWMDRSVLSAGLGVLSLTAGPVLAAFLLGVLSERARAFPVLLGMVVGFSVLIAVWWTNLVAWTWYAFVGAAVTVIVAWPLSLVWQEEASRAASTDVSRADMS